MSDDREGRGDTEPARAEAAEGASGAQASHYHSRMEAESDAPQREAARTPVEREGAGASVEGSAASSVRAQTPEEF
ncbi:MAG TPA: hypothetical protein VM914_08015, partial [Pyrinomonadaceae bacterium]|nr:hypothetical protein [Pyrinomonadaceae bacterium]